MFVCLIFSVLDLLRLSLKSATQNICLWSWGLGLICFEAKKIKETASCSGQAWVSKKWSCEWFFFFFCQQITWHFPMPFLHLSTVENNTSAHMETHTQNQNRNIIQDSNPLTIAGFKQSKMTSFFLMGVTLFFNCIIHLYREITSYDKRHEALRAFTSSVVFQFQRYLIWS